MKRIKQILACAALACALALAVAPPASAADQPPDLTLVATSTSGGGVSLNPKGVIFSSGDNIGCGDRSDAYLLFKNETGRTVEFSLRDIVNTLTDNPRSLYMLGGLDVQIIIAGDHLFTGTYREALGLTSDWITVNPGNEVPIRISYGLSPDADNSYQDLSYRVDYHFEVQTVDSPLPPSVSAVLSAPASGARAAAQGRMPRTGDVIAALLYAVVAALVGASLALVFFVFMKRRREQAEEQERAGYPGDTKGAPYAG